MRSRALLLGALLATAALLAGCSTGPVKPGQGLNLFFGLNRTTSGAGRTDGPVITYTANWISYTLHDHFGFVIAQKC